MQTDCGYTPAEIREMLWSDVVRLFEYWAIMPPVRALVAAFIGFKPAEETSSPDKYMSPEAFKMIVDSTRGGRDLIGRR